MSEDLFKRSRNYDRPATAPTNQVFSQRHGRIDWSMIKNTNIDTIIETGDVAPIQKILENITYSYLERDDIERYTEDGVIKLFKLSQLALESLLNGKSELQSQLVALKDQFQMVKTEAEQRDTIQRRREKELASLRAEVKHKKKALNTYEYMLRQPATAALIKKSINKSNALKCPFCTKFFVSQEYLSKHIEKRHPNKNPLDQERPGTAATTGSNLDKGQVSELIQILQKQTEESLAAQNASKEREMEIFKEQCVLQIAEIKERQKLQERALSSPQKTAQPQVVYSPVQPSENPELRSLQMENAELKKRIEESNLAYKQQFSELERRLERGEEEIRISKQRQVEQANQKEEKKQTPSNKTPTPEQVPGVLPPRPEAPHKPQDANVSTVSGDSNVGAIELDYDSESSQKRGDLHFHSESADPGDAAAPSKPSTAENQKIAEPVKVVLNPGSDRPKSPQKYEAVPQDIKKTNAGELEDDTASDISSISSITSPKDMKKPTKEIPQPPKDEPKPPQETPQPPKDITKIIKEEVKHPKDAVVAPPKLNLGVGKAVSNSEKPNPAEISEIRTPKDIQPKEITQAQFEEAVTKLGIVESQYKFIAKLSVTENLYNPWQKTPKGTYINTETNQEADKDPIQEHYIKMYKDSKAKDEQFKQMLQQFCMTDVRSSILPQEYKASQGIPTRFPYNTSEVDVKRQEVTQLIQQRAEREYLEQCAAVENWHEQKYGKQDDQPIHRGIQMLVCKVLGKQYIASARDTSKDQISERPSNAPDSHRQASPHSKLQPSARDIPTGTSPRLEAGENLIPARFCSPANFKDERGQRNGAEMSTVLKFQSKKVPNIFTFEDPVFRLQMTEGNPNENPTVAQYQVTAGSKPNVQVEYVNEKFNEFGINYVGMIKVVHKDERPPKPFVIKVPGELSYDPAAITKSEHASERIGGDCFNTQLAVTVAQVHAFIFGCPSNAVYDIQNATLSIMHKYHERLFLHDWMTIQVDKACYQKEDCEPYPEYLLKKFEKGEFRLDSDMRVHAIQYFNGYLAWKKDAGRVVRAPAQFYKKVASGLNSQDPFVLRDIGTPDWERIQKEAESAEITLTNVNAPELSTVQNPYLAKALRGETKQVDLKQEAMNFYAKNLDRLEKTEVTGKRVQVGMEETKVTGTRVQVAPPNTTIQVKAGVGPTRLDSPSTMQPVKAVIQPPVKRIDPPKEIDSTAETGQKPSQREESGPLYTRLPTKEPTLVGQRKYPEERKVPID